ncbi:MAG: hypothetical protein GY841_02030, partial [FCB group bacterium]|nr:hypothetical protein [FCB group bacterium]
HIKNVSPEDAIGRVRFEMASSLLDKPESFYIDALPIEENGKYRRFLSIAYHREEIDQQIKKYTDLLRKPSGFKLDAVALADGYLNFCQVEPGDLQVLVNIESESVVLAIIYRQKLRAIGRLEITPGDEISPKTATGLASELKMTVSYHLAELFQEGITVPPSRIILSGRHARNQTLKAALAEQINTELTLPNINRGIFQPASETIDRHPAERFLIPLGLALA